MQIEYSADDIINEINRISPKIIGISINFGQFDLACSILDKLFSENKTAKLIVAGNVISSFACSTLISRYPRLIICHSEGERTLFDLVKFLRGVIIENFDDDNKLVIAVFSYKAGQADVRLNREHEEYAWISTEKLLEYKPGRVLKSLQHVLVK